jgi:hypothetical protein
VGEVWATWRVVQGLWSGPRRGHERRPAVTGLSTARHFPHPMAIAACRLARSERSDGNHGTGGGKRVTQRASCGWSARRRRQRPARRNEDRARPGRAAGKTPGNFHNAVRPGSGSRTAGTDTRSGPWAAAAGTKSGLRRGATDEAGSHAGGRRRSTRPGVGLPGSSGRRQDRSVRARQTRYATGFASGSRSRSDGPLRAMRWARWTRRSRMASAKVGSARAECQASTGS